MKKSIKEKMMKSRAPRMALAIRRTALLGLIGGAIWAASGALGPVAGIAIARAATASKLINGAGATFPYPIYSKWFSEYNKQNQSIEINYQSIGSGGGIKQLIARTVDFGASDAPMSDDELKSAPAPIAHIPTVLGAVAITYNVPGIKQALRLSSGVLADIFLGKVAKWNDPRIAELNKGVALPAQDIVVIARADSSGTTFVFTDYLAKVSADWKAKVGAGKAVKWPTGMSAKGNEGVTGQLKNTPGSIGYVELVYAASEKLPLAELRNKSGQFVAPSVKSTSEAALGALKSMPEDYRVSIVDADGKGSYPISSFTYLLVYKSMPSEKGADFVKFLEWAMADGQKMAAGLNYAPLPPALVAKVKATIKQIKIN
jgi:phosphate transport system substrate-binding protein